MSNINIPFNIYIHHELFILRMDTDDTILFTPLKRKAKAKKNGNTNSLNSKLPNSKNPMNMSNIPPANHHPHVCL